MALPRWFPKWAENEPRRHKTTIIGIAAALFLGISIYSLVAKSNHPQFGWNGTFDPDRRLDVLGENAAVASDVAECSRMGVNVLQNGGSAADAAVQVALCIGTMAPQSSGIGGGGFITVHFPNGTNLVIDARETAPAAAHKHMYDDNPFKSKWFGLATAVPGELAGLEALWKMGGKLPWADLVEPVAELNEVGFAREEALQKMANTYLTYVDKLAPGHIERMIENSDWCWLFQDHPKCKGRSSSTASTIKRPQLAKTLRTIAREGVSAFYEGPIAEHLVNITQKTGGILTLEDMANYSVIVRPALESAFQNRTIVTAPEPASGPALLMGLRAIEKLVPLTNSESLEDDPIFQHRVVEVMKWMAAARSELGDPAYINNPRIGEMQSAQWANNVAANVSDNATLPSWRDYHPSFEMNNPAGTTHFSIVDKDGMAVAMTTTVNLPFGNAVSDPFTGVVLNSEMDDFSIPHQRNSFELAPSIYNFVAPGKRPLSSTVPSVLLNNGSVDMVIGAAGGSRILTSVFQALVRAYIGDRDPLEAVSFPRFHHQLIPESLFVEPGFSEELRNQWSQRGHNLDMQAPASAMNLIQKDESGTYHAIGDFYRKRGLGAAY